MTSKISTLLSKVPEVFFPFFLLGGKAFLSERSYTVLRWKLSHGDETRSINYPLKKNSIVFDVGGYLGDWSDTIYKKYQCTMYIFEPISEYSKKIENRFKGIRKIHVVPCGLAGKDKTIYLHMSNEKTSEFSTSGKKVKIQLINIKEFMKKNQINHIDLASINIEGGEYDLLTYLLKTKLIKKFENIQIQFHSFVPNALLKMHKIQKTLQKTHTLLYQFPFVWESWTYKKE